MIANDSKYACPINAGVYCPPFDNNGKPVKKDCAVCGWNPKVAESRLKMMGITPDGEKIPQK